MIELRRTDHVLVIELNRPEVRNALNVAMLDDLAEAWRSVANDRDVRAVVLTGAGNEAFSAGADLNVLADFDPATQEPFHDAFYPELLGVQQPVIAAINGHAIAGGLELVGATDIRIASETATFALAEARVGLFAAGGSVVRLTRQLPWAVAMDLILTARTIDAREAHRCGLVNRVVPQDEVLQEAMRVAEHVATLAPVAVRAMKECAMRSSGRPLDQAFREQEPLIRAVLATADAKEGPRAFLEKRKPQFVGY